LQQRDVAYVADVSVHALVPMLNRNFSLSMQVACSRLTLATKLLSNRVQTFRGSRQGFIKIEVHEEYFLGR
jgi:hypothetical protein